MPVTDGSRSLGGAEGEFQFVESNFAAKIADTGIGLKPISPGATRRLMRNGGPLLPGRKRITIMHKGTS